MRNPPFRHWQNYNEPGHAHELTFTCYQRFQFFKAERTCHWLAESIDEARKKFRSSLWAFVFMPEHVHLIVYPQSNEYDIAKIKSVIKEPVGRKSIKFLKANDPDWLPKITRQRGERTERLFWLSGGGNDRNITEPETLTQMIDYIHLNTVRRGLVERAVYWKWSSAGWFAGEPTRPLIPDKIPPEWTT
jgi:putative transposase